MKIVLAAFVLLDMVLLAYSVDNYTIIATAWPQENDWEYPFGNCTARENWKIHTTCNAPFMHGLQKKKACIPLIEQMEKCRVDLHNTTKCKAVEKIKGGYTYFMNESVKVLCEKAGLSEWPIYQIDKVKGGGTKRFFPCSISDNKYTEELKKCNSKMLEMWKKDRADPMLCRAYSSTKRCKKQLVETKCNYTGETKALVDLQFGSYNPFCPGDVDITSGTAFRTPFGTFALTAVLFLAILISQQ